MATLRALSDAGRPEDATALDTLALLLEQEPEFALDAPDAIDDPASVPLVLRLKRGEPKQVEGGELRALIAALYAVADWCEGGKVSPSRSTAQPGMPGAIEVSRETGRTAPAARG